ncbi:chorismate synthase (macronuclear) [Tetrahymena thermophila SB210]|uniref:chorismate synthase n=1 Tax=Tetrahymena thermophila (strain SB210) TaxID=312017 RepID=Q23FV7_TETTS|nr:chorismate synthase [Tetrahymena thermophila SB210]EAR95503.1 chorismate synthase [Tetrahymena thermophila SB210]|eukprot:XP_001015748.1 chorismate synthase [Tetrahymena thermophila SB210]
MSTFGRIYRVSTFGESHSPAVGCTVEGFPSLIKVQREEIQKALDRRRPGQSSLTTKRNETDQVEILCGLENEISIGSPIAFLVRNQDQIKKDYSEMDQIPRPGHADYTYLIKYGVKAQSGGGRSSARETIGRVCAGALADIYLEKQLNMNVFSFVTSVGDIQVPNEFIDKIVNSTLREYTKERIDALGSITIFKDTLDHLIYKCDNIFYNEQGDQILSCEENLLAQLEVVNMRCPHPPTAIKMIQKIQSIRGQKDSIGGTVTCVIQNTPIGLGEPCFDKLPALLAHAIMSIPATKGFQIGSGFEGTKMQGSQHNDTFYSDKLQNTQNTEKQEETKQESVILKTMTNNAGGTLGGISNGQSIYFSVAFKPVSTIGLPQKTSNLEGESTILEAKGRHDPCVLPRAPPIVDSMASITLMDAYLLQQTHVQKVKEGSSQWQYF